MGNITLVFTWIIFLAFSEISLIIWQNFKKYSENAKNIQLNGLTATRNVEDGRVMANWMMVLHKAY